MLPDGVLLKPQEALNVLGTNHFRLHFRYKRQLGDQRYGREVVQDEMWAEYTLEGNEYWVWKRGLVHGTATAAPPAAIT